MAQGRRVERVAASIRREVSELLVTGIRDERVNQAMVSVTSVDVAGDLQHCKVHVSIFGSEEDRQQALAGLRSASSYVKGELGRRLNMRRTPEVIFLLDRGLEKGTAVLGLINKLGAERLAKGDVPPGSDGAPDGATDRAGDGAADFNDTDFDDDNFEDDDFDDDNVEDPDLEDVDCDNTGFQDTGVKGTDDGDTSGDDGKGAKALDDIDPPGPAPGKPASSPAPGAARAAATGSAPADDD